MRFLRLLPVWVALSATSACDSDLFRLRWFAAPDTAVIYSMARPELNLNSAFNFVGRAAVRIEAPNIGTRFDMALDTQGGALVLLPPGALGVISDAGILELPGVGFDEVREAPDDDDAYTTDQPLIVRTGSLYVVRTHEELNSFGQRCNYYAKFVPLEVDATRERLTFEYDRNTICNSRRLEPDER